MFNYYQNRGRVLSPEKHVLFSRQNIQECDYIPMAITIYSKTTPE
jgi:hypothetical protein